MDIRIVPITFANVSQLEDQAATATTWELPWVENQRPTICDDPGFDKQLWIQSVLMHWGTCGFTAFVGTGETDAKLRPAATAFFAPASYFPGYGVLASAPVSPDAILLSHVYVAAAYIGLYMEQQLIGAVVEHARRRGVKAVEAFARVGAPLGLEDLCADGDGVDFFTRALSIDDASLATVEIMGEADHGETYDGDRESSGVIQNSDLQNYLNTSPMLPVDIVEAQGFHVVQDDPQYPRYRLDVPNSGSVFAAYGEDPVSASAPWPTVLGGRKESRRYARASFFSNSSKL